MTLIAVTLVGTAGLLTTAMGEDPAQPSGRATLIAVSSAVYEPPCTDAQQGITYYRKAYTASREKMGLVGAVPRVWYRDCEVVRRRAGEWMERAKNARLELHAWTQNQWNWARWLPDKWQRIGACETGYGQRPGNWKHNSGSYQGAFGFANQSWDSFVPHADPTWGPYPSEAYEATPRQQYEVALAIYRRYGLSGWGCRAA